MYTNNFSCLAVICSTAVLIRNTIEYWVWDSLPDSQNPFQIGLGVYQNAASFWTGPLGMQWDIESPPDFSTRGGSIIQL